MYVRRNPEMKALLEELWKRYLLTATAGDIMLGEVADQLYVSDLDFKALEKKGQKVLLETVVDTGFWDDIEGAVEEILESPERMKPYGELSRWYSADDLAEALYQEILAHTHFYDAKEVTGNPYYRTIHPQKAAAGHIQLTSTDYLAGEFFETYHAAWSREDPFGYADIAFFDDRVPFPVLLENGQVWMSVVMSEIESMKRPIEEAHGQVITYGLGLGYYTFMAAEKEDVESVTVVEMNPAVISLFTRYLLPQFPHKEKIHIVKGDAMQFVDRQADGEYDEAFADFWGGVEAALPFYLDFYPKTARFTKTRFSYWIESCFLEYYFRPVLLKVLMEKGTGEKKILPKVGKFAGQVEKEFEAYLWSVEGELETADDIWRWLNIKTLLPLMRRFAVKRSGGE